MLKRIVKLTFKTEHIPTFQTLFEETKMNIRGFEGCRHLELWQDANDPRIFFTYSFWENEEHLEAYRHSDLFKATWSRTKILFDDRPQAWSVRLASETH
jgi:heme-degrading monooxygenase HmoA